MQKREQGKQGGGASGGSAPPAAKRGRPFGSTAAAAAAAAASDAVAPSTLLGPSLQVHSTFAGLRVVCFEPLSGEKLQRLVKVCVKGSDATSASASE
ncbi:hypothetical protein LguiB_014473 [Lonicera macranthoides]